uniref:C2H2-type domain-containing protein n=1 Tax=Timema douglasi TaxID=61478 RepID=A0A7R8Z4H6_TIMDO|nr:unnamed protein product [Timema douglasi]
MVQVCERGTCFNVQVKSQEILKILETSGQSFTRDQETKILKCEICEVVVNSSQQLQTHLADWLQGGREESKGGCKGKEGSPKGNKHKQRALKKVSSGSLGVGKPVPGNTVSTSIADGVNYTQDGVEVTVSGDSGSGSAGEGPKEADSPRTSKFYCEVCNVSLNSEIQLDQHMTARKHKERESNGGRPKTRPAPYWRRGGHPMRGAKKGPKVPIAMQYSQPLSNNFVSGGAML